MKKKIRGYVKILQHHVDRVWYPPLIGILAAADNFVIVIPNDGILISSGMLAPNRWLRMAMHVALGSTLGALALAAVVEIEGLPWVLSLYPWLPESELWTLSTDFFDRYGLYLVFIVALTPLAQQPTVILASLAHTPYFNLFLAIFAGRTIKYLVLSYIASHAPRVLRKFWGLKRELEKAGVNIKNWSP